MNLLPFIGSDALFAGNARVARRSGFYAILPAQLFHTDSTKPSDKEL